jgi:TonB family protein
VTLVVPILLVLSTWAAGGQAPGQCVLEPARDTDITALFTLVRCYDTNWKWEDGERALERTIAEYDTQTVEAVRTQPSVVDGRFVAGVHIPMPARTRHVDPDYPSGAYAEGRSGFVILELHIDEQGNVREATAVRPVRGFDGVATRAAKRWKYAPTIVDGKAVPVVTYAGMRFGSPGEPVPSDWIDLAEFHHTHGRPRLAKAALSAALARLRDDRQRYAGLAAPRRDATARDAIAPDITPPVKVTHVNPQYPREALSGRIQGRVEIRGIIDVRGKVGRPSIVSKPSLLDGAALAAVQQWAFTPALKAGVPTAVVIIVTVDFSLR